MNPLIVSAPFGNYHRFLKYMTGADFTPTVGTFTSNPRGFWTPPYGGRLTRLLLSVRYSPTFRSWVNKIGLKNQGIRWYYNRVQQGLENPADKIISIYGFNHVEWVELLATVSALKPLAVEINASCPNVHRSPFDDKFFAHVMGAGILTIVKIPPVNYRETVKQAYAAGVRIFHATNTLPTPHGGMSGKALKPVSLEVVATVRALYPDVVIIGGGGVTTVDDAVDYTSAGANHVAIGTALFNPLNWRKVKAIAEAADRSRNLFGVLG